jgi:hypothetical protein
MFNAFYSTRKATLIYMLSSLEPGQSNFLNHGRSISCFKTFLISTLQDEWIASESDNRHDGYPQVITRCTTLSMIEIIGVDWLFLDFECTRSRLTRTGWGIR